ncbi:hypothetical protein [Methanoculleus sp.]|uniref:hypothetical protein n=1 Tax=Methanoculleus sp. TaxID=90427 RepID=UPI002FCB5821
MRHLVDRRCHGEDGRVVVPRLHLHAVGVPDPEPLLRDLDGMLPAPGCDPGRTQASKEINL